MYKLMHYIYIDALHLQPTPLWVTFSNAVSKLKARTSLSTETWQKRRSSFELWAFENITPSGIGCTLMHYTLMRYIYIDALHFDALHLHWCITSRWMYTRWLHSQPVPDRLRLELVIGMEIEILDFQSSCLYSYEPFEKRPLMIIQHFHFPFDDHFECHLFGNGLYREYKDWSITCTERYTYWLYERLVEVATLTGDNDALIVCNDSLHLLFHTWIGSLHSVRIQW